MAEDVIKQIENLKAINNKCSNGWKLNLLHYKNCNEKTLLKVIEIDNNNCLQFSLEYNNKNQILLKISELEYIDKQNKLAQTNGIIKNVVLDKTILKRKNVNKLIEVTKQLTDEELLKLNRTTQEGNK